MPTVTSVSVTARPVVLTADVAGVSAKAERGNIEMAGTAAIPIKSLRRSGDIRPRLVSSDMSTPSGFEDWRWSDEDCPVLCTAQIRKIAYIAPQNSDVGWPGSCEEFWVKFFLVGELRDCGRAAADRPRQAPI